MKLVWVVILGLSVLENPWYSLLVCGQNVTDGVKFRELYRYRKIHWCITGLDEPTLHIWPFSQFVHILERSTQRFTAMEDMPFRYKLKFYAIKTEQTDVGNKGALYKTLHIAFTAEGKRDAKVNILQKWSPHPIEGLIIQANYNPESIAMPAGEFFRVDDPIKCSDCNSTLWAHTIPCRKRSVLHMVHPNVLAFHHEMRPHGALRRTAKAGARTEIHANFRWYSPPCAEVSRLLFYALVVRSFNKNEYDVVKFGPYETAARGQNRHSQIHPSPLNQYFITKEKSVFCHGSSVTDLLTEQPEKFINFEMSSKFDCCTRNEENPKNPQIRAFQTTQKSFSCSAAANASVENPYTIPFGKESWVCDFPRPIKCRHTTPAEHPYKLYKQCQSCPAVPSTSRLTTTTLKPKLIKRSVHGMMMIMTNFCLQPIVIYVARFYKETYNAVLCKGTKSWYWMHMFGGMISSVTTYFGYFSGSSDDDKKIQAHVILGNIYIMILAFCYMTAWGRNKNSIINIIMEFLHGCLGYTVITMAVVSIATSPSLGFESQLCIYLMVGFQCLFMFAMTCHICRLDKEFGMKPKRRHFPTVEARFDEVTIPGGKFRKSMLTIFALITFLLSVTSTFFQ